MKKRREYPKLPMAAVGAVTTRGDEVLLVRRSHEPSRGLWSIPGGLVELGEAVRDALKREVLEETGLEVEGEDLLGVIDKIVYDDKGAVRFHYVLIDFQAHPVAGGLREDEGVRWVGVDELDLREVTQTTRRLLRKIGFG